MLLSLDLMLLFFVLFLFCLLKTSRLSAFTTPLLGRKEVNPNQQVRKQLADYFLVEFFFSLSALSD